MVVDDKALFACWLLDVGFEQYQGMFEQAEVDSLVHLPVFDDEELEIVGVQSKLHRPMILKRAQAVDRKALLVNYCWQRATAWRAVMSL